MADTKLSGLAIAEGIAGFVLFWSGLKNQSLKDTLTSLLKGQPPSVNPEAAPTLGISSAAPPPPAPGDTTGTGQAPGTTTAAGRGSGGPAAPANVSGNVATGKLMAAAYGWTGSEWDALYNLWERESGWSNTVANSSSGALGIAQALGHGTATSAGSLGNEYPSKSANNGNAAAQIAWGLSYIKQRYGDPLSAWAHETADGWY